MKKFAIFLASFVMMFAFVANVFAINCDVSGTTYTCPNKGLVPDRGYGSYGTCVCVNVFGQEDVDTVGGATGLQNTSLPLIVGNIVKAVLGLFGIVATVIIVYGGFKWMTSQGEPESIEKAKKLMIAGAIGMVLIVSGYAITTFLINNLLMKAVGA